MYEGLLIKYPLLLSDLMKLLFFDRFSKNTQIYNYMKILSLGAELLHADRQTDRHDEANSRFSQFCESD